MAVNAETTIRKLVSMPRAMVEAVKDFRFQERIDSESEAIRRLVELGLEAAKQPVKAENGRRALK